MDQDYPKPAVIPNSSGMDVRITKTVRMRQRYGLMLKEEAYRQTMKTGNKVSEADLLDEALAEYEIRLQVLKQREERC
ncbi:hypothetical protein [Vreelandella populi]|uniref:hypothetical protein n=1 Tax=Vreelandella populi TaxID=2498858 RepID=UPI000F8C8325|nr:hypothetical protein [Halomonas populi]RUR52016.1 hypothetical protein ELY40_14990 [Halomonas populi]